MQCIWWFTAYSLYKEEKRSFSPTSNISQGHILRLLYVNLIFWNLILTPETNLNPVEFGRNSVDSELLSDKCIVTLPEMYTATICKMSVQQVWRFMRRILQVHWRRMLYLSLPIDSVGQRIRYGNIKVFTEPHFSIYGQNPRTYTQKYVSQKTRMFPYFTESDVFHWLAQKITHHWTSSIDIMLKINNCKEIFS